MVIRPGGPGDADAVLNLLDAAVVWLNAQGNTEQWGTQPWSARPRSVDRIHHLCQRGLWLAELDGEPVGALAVSGQPGPGVPAVAEPELYVNLLVTSRAHQGQGVGTALLEHARTLAGQWGVGLMRVDCFGGRDGALIRVYERAGFTRSDTFTVSVRGLDWPGQVLEMRL